MDPSSKREGEEHEVVHHRHRFARGTYDFTSSRVDHGSPSHSHHPQTRDWFATTTQPSAEDNSTCIRSSYNFMEGNINEGDESKVRRRLEHQPQASSSSYFNSHSSHHSQTLAAIEQMIEKEHMFDKVVTPSDVGKLNRLVIPKQHAERYFPLDSSANEKGLLLNFEDTTRKLWRFRYSYWNSSQSYVMTKGWSRFVKEKKLDAGDIVSFQRGMSEAFRDRLFIDWRRRPRSNPLLFHHDQPSLIVPSLSLPRQYFPFHQGNRSVPWVASASMPLYLRPVSQLTSGHHFPQQNFNNFHSHSHNYNQYYNQQQHLQQGVISHQYGASAVGSSSQTVVYLKSSADESYSGSGDGMNSMVLDSAPTVIHPRKAEGKINKLRLFGVNMECENLSNSIKESENLSSSSSPIQAMVTSPQYSPHFGNENDTSSDPNDQRSQGSISLNLSF